MGTFYCRVTIYYIYCIVLDMQLSIISFTNDAGQVKYP